MDLQNLKPRTEIRHKGLDEIGWVVSTNPKQDTVTYRSEYGVTKTVRANYLETK